MYYQSYQCRISDHAQKVSRSYSNSQGRLEEHEMDKMGIPQKRDSNDKRSTTKSDRPLSQQRGLILRHACVQAFYKAYQEKKNQDPLLRTEIASGKKAALAVRKAAKLECDAKSPEEK